MPELRDDLVPYWVAFNALNLSRTMNGTIPVSEIAAYLDLTGITDIDERLEWLHLIGAMDRAYLDAKEGSDGG